MMSQTLRPIVVSTRVARPREEVYAFLDVLANHEQFTDHMLVDWSFSGPPSGVGARCRMRARASRKDWMELEVLEVEAPAKTVEETVGAGGRRRTRGTYTLRALDDGATEVRFELHYLEVPRSERLLAPVIHAYMQRANARAMTRLAAVLEPRPSRTAPA